MKAERWIIGGLIVFGLLCVGVIAGQHDEEIEEAAYEAGWEAARESIWSDAYSEGFGDGVAESQAGNAFIVDENYLKIYDEGYYEGKAYYKEHLDSFLHEIELEDLIDCLWGDYGYDFIEFFNDYTGCNFVDLSADGDG